MSEAFLPLDHCTMQFCGLKAVADLSFEIARGELLGLIGPNGAGKTTVFNMITGVYTPTQGTVTFDGRQISGLKANRIACCGITRTFQNIRLFSRLTCLDNFAFPAPPHRPARPWARVVRTPGSVRHGGAHRGGGGGTEVGGVAVAPERAFELRRTGSFTSRPEFTAALAEIVRDRLLTA